MGIFRHLPASLALLLTAGSAAAQASKDEWVSYRDAYRAMVVFEKYGKSKNLIQNHFQVMAKDKRVSADGLQLTLQGKTIRLNLPLDASGRAVFPLLKAAYDENAALVLNRKVSQYLFRPRVSIVVRPDGVYEGADLREACEQMLAYQRYADASFSAKKCAGVRFVFVLGAADPDVKLRRGESGAALPPRDGPAFADDAYDGFRVVTYRFADAAGKGQVVTQDAPLAITPLYE